MMRVRGGSMIMYFKGTKELPLTCLVAGLIRSRPWPKDCLMNNEEVKDLRGTWQPKNCCIGRLTNELLGVANACQRIWYKLLFNYCKIVDLLILALLGWQSKTGRSNHRFCRDGRMCVPTPEPESSGILHREIARLCKRIFLFIPEHRHFHVLSVLCLSFPTLGPAKTD